MNAAFADAVKANDPAAHRPIQPHNTGPASYSHLPQSGRRSVVGRPPSVASSSSAAASIPFRAIPPRSKTPTTRPASRQSAAFDKGPARVDRSFDVGDNVRIESLGFEGTLRFIGEIDGKSGQWAGVELGGGFAGKGKNDGSVNNKHYFVCPPKCGVFVALAKLSPPTVGPGSISRPSSVASSRSGRVTPSVSGRITPSYGLKNNGRVTPSMSTSRVTSAVTPAARTPTPKARTSPNGYEAVTPGSRASRYVGVTAKQLTSRAPGGPPIPPSPTRFAGRASPPSLIHAGKTPRAAQGTRPMGLGIGSPAGTPTKGRTSLMTPRGRIPSAIAMPPPPSPGGSSTRSQSVSLNDYPQSSPIPNAFTSNDLEMNGRAIQDQVAQLLSGRASHVAMRTPPPHSPPASHVAFPLADSAESLRPLQLKLEALQAENDQLKALAEARKNGELESVQRAQSLQEDRDRTVARTAELEMSVKTAERALSERTAQIEGLERAVAHAAADVEKAKSDGEARLRDLQSRLDDKESLMKDLKGAIEAKEAGESETNAALKAKNAEIALLEARVQKAYAELEEERRELGGQVDELRQAGQETIALYEERMSAAETKRYELEDAIAALQEQSRAQTQPPSPSVARFSSSAAQIENETLRDQVVHLQSKLAALEDTLEDARATADKEEAMVHDRMKRFREKEEGLRAQVAEGEKELERVLKSEEGARARIEEIEEAFREATVALENARAEIEVLRAEIANLEGLAADPSSPDASDRIAEVAQRAAADRTRAAEEIAQLKATVEQLRLSKAEAQPNGDTSDLEEIAERLFIEKDQLEDQQTKLQETIAELRERLEQQASEIESLRKRAQRDLPVQDILPDARPAPPPSPSRYETSALREEIAGLKHIVEELRRESAAASQRNKLLESENKLLISETDQLRDEMKALENSVEQSLLREEQALEEGSPTISDDVASLRRALKELKAKHETDIDQLRKKQADAELKSARTIHDLNKEVSELESLIESKIYREDELEQEVDRLKDKLSRSHKKSSTRLSDILSHTTDSETVVSDDTPVGPHGSDVCEICEQPGHDIFTCDVLKGNAPAPSRPQSS
ncbi:hypothetical protein HETIRDRAFT_434703, partial [Heterobasidion irregulare TC 32-1]